jgi:hypothetical protein
MISFGDPRNFRRTSSQVPIDYNSYRGLRKENKYNSTPYKSFNTNYPKGNESLQYKEPYGQDLSRIEKLYRLKGTSGYMNEREKGTFEYLIIILIVILIVVIIVAIYNALSYTPRRLRDNDTKYLPEYDPDFLDMDIGGSRDGYVYLRNAESIKETPNTNSSKIGKDIVCREPFFGPKCEIEAWDNQFYSFGSTSNSNILGLQASNSIEASSKTWVNEVYSDKSCSRQSLDDKNSIGFAYNDGKCRLLYGEVEVVDKSLVSYDPLVESEIYLKRTKDPKFKPKVRNEVYFGIKGNGFLRHYLDRDDSNSFVKVPTGTVKEVNIQPFTTNNPYGYKGIWSLNVFTGDEFDDMYALGGSESYYVDNGDGTIVLPAYLRDKNNFFVMYK